MKTMQWAGRFNHHDIVVNLAADAYAERAAAEAELKEGEAETIGWLEAEAIHV